MLYSEIKISHVKAKYAISTCYLKNYTMHVTWNLHANFENYIGHGTIHATSPCNPQTTLSKVTNHVVPSCKLKTSLCMDNDHAICPCKPKTTLCVGIYRAIPLCKPKTTLCLGIYHAIPPCKPKIALCMGTNHAIPYHACMHGLKHDGQLQACPSCFLRLMYILR